VTLGFTDNMRCKLLCWAALMYIGRLLAYGTPCVSVEVAELVLFFVSCFLFLFF
jgi:hypothetical protein